MSNELLHTLVARCKEINWPPEGDLKNHPVFLTQRDQLLAGELLIVVDLKAQCGAQVINAPGWLAAYAASRNIPC